MIKVIADDKIPFLKGVLDPFVEVRYLPGSMINKDAISEADALLIRTRTKCTRSFLQNTTVRFIGTATIGFDHIDTRYCDRHNIKWINAPGCNSSSVQQYIAGALLKVSHDFRFELKGKTIGIIGVGNVGSKVEKLARHLGMNVLLNDPPRARREGMQKFTDLNTLYAESDIVTLHVPLAVVGEDRTYHMINRRSAKKIKKGAWFINTSRGEVADTGTLIKSLESGRFAGAVIDVWENEPDIDQELMERTFIATPHIAGYSTDGKANGTSMVINEFAAFFGLPFKNWFPDYIPDPENPVINVDGNEKTDEEILREAVSATYEISEDDIRLRFSPADFEKQRGEYPARREFPAYSIKLKNCSAGTGKLLLEMGFKVLS